MSQRRRVPGGALSPAAPRAPRHTTAAPCAVAARAGCHRTPGGAQRVAQRAVHRPVARRSPCHVARGAAVPLCPAHNVSGARGGHGSARAARPGPASGVYRTRARGNAPESGLVVGHHQTQGLDPVPLLLAVRHPRPLQPLRGGLDGRAPRKCAPGGAPDCGDLPEAGHRPAPTHHSCGPWRAYAEHSSSRCSSRIWASTPVIRGPA